MDPYHFVGALEGGEAVDDLEDLLGPHRVESLLGDDRLHEPALGARGVRQAEDERQCELALLEVGEDRLCLLYTSPSPRD